MTPHISTLTPAGALGAAAAWPDEREALLGRLLWHIHTPYAQAFVATANEAVLGIGCCIVHATSGRITLLRAQDDASRTALAAALVAHLETAGATTQLITVTEEDVSFWSALGFVAQGNLIRYTGGRFLQATRDEVIHLEPFHRMAVMRQDKQATGEDRGTWLWEHAYLGRVYAERNLVLGFSLTLPGHALIVADAPDVGLELQRWILPIQEHLLLPEGNTFAAAHLRERGYRAETIGVRMCFIPPAGVRGAALTYRPELIYAEPFGPV